MELNKDEALRAKENAEKRFGEKDFVGAKIFALQALALNPELEGIHQMVATLDVYIASQAKAEIKCYSILGLKPSSNKDTAKKQYRKLARLLHPDKNKSLGADVAFKLVSEAWTILSDNFKRLDRQISFGPVQSHGSSALKASCKPSIPPGNPETFWTVCTSCKIQYEYLRKYLNKKLRCKNCRGVFIAVESGHAPKDGSFPYSSWLQRCDNAYGSNGHNGVYLPSNSIVFTGNGASVFHTGHELEYGQSLSFQQSSFPAVSGPIVDRNGLRTKSGNVLHYHAEEKVKLGASGNHYMKSVVSNGSSSVEPPGSRGRPSKKQKLAIAINGIARNGHEDAGSEVRILNGNKTEIRGTCETVMMKRCSITPAFDARKLLMDRARTEIQRKLEEMKLASAAADKIRSGIPNTKKEAKKADTTGALNLIGQLEPGKIGPSSINVPDPDFHDFDKDRSEDCFKPKQIWALYDEEDGMPRLYCLIREVVSVRPFNVHISYLNSKTDTEFGVVNWMDSGFTKSCGNFRATNPDVVNQVNIFSHVLNGRKAGRGGCIRVYPKCGDIWAVYRNWSKEWDHQTLDEVRHEYEMVEVLDNYYEEFGVCVMPLVKMNGFKTVYQRNSDQAAMRWIPRREMLRFSHQVPSWPLEGEANHLPEGCWDLDPAAMPEMPLDPVTISKFDQIDPNCSG